MVNIEEFTKKLEKILEYYSLSASSFADKIGVQRSSMSHLLSGRNKPSLDFVLKITDVFPEVDLYWLLLNKGNFPKDESTKILKTENSNKSDISNFSPELFDQSTRESKKEAFIENESQNLIETSFNNGNQYNSVVEKIVVFYTDGTFKQYIQKNKV